MTFSMQAMILAAGLGKRMRAYTQDVPKPLVRIAQRPLIEYSFQLLRNAGITGAVVNTHYMADQMHRYLESIQTESMPIAISHESELLETGGGVLKALSLLAEPFFVLNSDVICNDTQPPVLQRMRQYWDPITMTGLLLLQPLEKAIGYQGSGDFSLAQDGRILPKVADAPAYVFTGVQLLSRPFFANAPEGPFSLSVLYRQALNNPDTRLYGLVHEGEWFHVGDPEGVAAAEHSLKPETWPERVLSI